jgi:O-antigen ligase
VSPGFGPSPRAPTLGLVSARLRVRDKRTLTALLREAPATLPALGVLALTVAWATDQAGYPQTHWAPGGLVVGVLLAIAVVAVPPRWAGIPSPVRLAVACLAAYTVLSFLSILWAGVPGDAWEGADRTLLYLEVFALLACWRQTGASATVWVCAWALALSGVAVYTLLHVSAAAGSAARVVAELPGGRLQYPAGYANADAALWLMAAWPALLLARSPRLPWALRGALAAGAVVLAEVALLSQSRGALYATPVLLALVFAAWPGRVRTFALLVPVAAGIAAAAPAVLRVGDRVSALERGGPGAAAALRATAAALHDARTAVLLAAAAVGVVVAVGGRMEEGRAFSPRVQRRVHRSLAALATGLLVALLAGGWAVAGDPLARARHAWDTFRSPSAYAADATTGSRLTGGLGSERYDFYRVALDEFAAHPLLGIGADNFAEAYLAHGRSDETPRYPHSVELRTLVETGLVGALLALVGLGGAGVATWRVLTRHPDPLARAAAAAAAAGFVYWGVHGSFDWFWEFAGLGVPAFALLGLCCGLAPRGAPAGSAAGGDQPGAAGAGGPPDAVSAAPAAGPPAGSRPPWQRACALAVAGVLAVAVAAAFTLPWLSRLQVQSAAAVWVEHPGVAYARLNAAARLNPLSAEPYEVAGTIALRRGEVARADREFALALARTPGDAYATLERGAIASAQGRRRAALAELARAVRLDPREELARAALAQVRSGHRVDVWELNRSILLSAGQLS